jgi:hypothetical protein
VQFWRIGFLFTPSRLAAGSFDVARSGWQRPLAAVQAFDITVGVDPSGVGLMGFPVACGFREGHAISSLAQDWGIDHFLDTDVHDACG